MNLNQIPNPMQGVFLQEAIRWDSTISYKKDVIIRWKGILYKALADNKDKEPGISPTYWQDYRFSGDSALLSSVSIGDSKAKSFTFVKSDSFSLPSAINNATIFMTCLDRNNPVYLPTGATNDGRQVTLIKGDSGPGKAILYANTADSIVPPGGDTVKLYAKYDHVTVQYESAVHRWWRLDGHAVFGPTAPDLNGLVYNYMLLGNGYAMQWGISGQIVTNNPIGNIFDGSGAEVIFPIRFTVVPTVTYGCTSTSGAVWPGLLYPLTVEGGYPFLFGTGIANQGALSWIAIGRII